MYLIIKEQDIIIIVMFFVRTFIITHLRTLMSMLLTYWDRCNVAIVCTYCDRCDADSGEHLFDQSVAVVERLHHQTLLSGHLREKEKQVKTRVSRCFNAASQDLGYSGNLLVDHAGPHSAAGSSEGPSSHRTTAPWSSSTETDTVHVKCKSDITTFDRDTLCKWHVLMLYCCDLPRSLCVHQWDDNMTSYAIQPSKLLKTVILIVMCTFLLFYAKSPSLILYMII